MIVHNGPFMTFKGPYPHTNFGRIGTRISQYILASNLAPIYMSMHNMHNVYHPLYDVLGVLTPRTPPSYTTAAHLVPLTLHFSRTQLGSHLPKPMCCLLKCLADPMRTIADLINETPMRAGRIWFTFGMPGLGSRWAC